MKIKIKTMITRKRSNLRDLEKIKKNCFTTNDKGKTETKGERK